MPQAIRIEIPLIWLRKVSPNRRHGNWAHRHREHAELRESAMLLALEQGERRGRWPIKEPRAFATCLGRKQWDRDNLIASLKPVMDGLADALVLCDTQGRPDDRHVDWVHARSVRQRAGAERVVLTILGS